MRHKPYVWQMVKEAVVILGGKASYADIKDYIREKYGVVNESTVNCQIIKCTVNHPSRIHYPINQKPRIANTKYDFLYWVESGVVELYNPDIHGIWKISKNKQGKFSIYKINW